MTIADRVVADLVNALDTIIREIDRPNTRVPFIYGVATQAITNCDVHRERNSDGYLVLKGNRASTPAAGLAQTQCDDCDRPRLCGIVKPGTRPCDGPRARRPEGT